MVELPPTSPSSLCQHLSTADLAVATAVPAYRMPLAVVPACVVPSRPPPARRLPGHHSCRPPRVATYSTARSPTTPLAAPAVAAAILDYCAACFPADQFVY